MSFHVSTITNYTLTYLLFVGNRKRGDCVHNCALGDFANEGKVLSDGRFLRDLSFSYDAVGHLPGWLNAMAFSPSHFHSTIASSTEEGPIVYLGVFHLFIELTATCSQRYLLRSDSIPRPNTSHFDPTPRQGAITLAKWQALA